MYISDEGDEDSATGKGAQYSAAVSNSSPHFNPSNSNEGLLSFKFHSFSNSIDLTYLMFRGCGLCQRKSVYHCN